MLLNTQEDCNDTSCVMCYYWLDAELFTHTYIEKYYVD